MTNIIKFINLSSDIAFVKRNVQKRLCKQLFMHFNSQVFQLYSFAFYKSDWHLILLCNVTRDRGTDFIKVQNVSFHNQKGYKTLVLNVPDVLSCNEQKPPHDLHFLKIWLVLHSLNEIFMNTAQALPFFSKILSSNQLLGHCPFCLNQLE